MKNILKDDTKMTFLDRTQDDKNKSNEVISKQCEENLTNKTNNWSVNKVEAAVKDIIKKKANCNLNASQNVSNENDCDEKNYIHSFKNAQEHNSSRFSKFPSCSALIVENISACDKEKFKLSFIKPSVTNEAPLKQLNLSIAIVKETEIILSNKILGRGAQGCVFKGKFRGSDVAVKVIPKRLDDKSIKKEIKLLDSVRHANIVSIMGVSINLTQIFIITEFFESHSLHEVIYSQCIAQQFALNDIKKLSICKQVCTALAYLHEQETPIIHRDVKPANILLNKFYQVKVCDLGISRCESLSTDLVTTHGVICGTFSYMAPEIFLNSEIATAACDVWSFACVVIELFNCCSVWEKMKNEDFYSSARRNLQSQNIPSFISVPKNLHNSLKRCFSYNSKQRPTMLNLISSFS